MLSLAISVAAGLAVNILLAAAVGLQVWIATLIGVAVFAVVYLLLSRYFIKQISALMESAQRDIMAGRVEKAVKTLQGGFRYSRWHFVRGALNAQVGMVLYLKRDFAEAFEYLQKGTVRHWVAMAMLAICYMKRNKSAKMTETFEKATTVTRKEPLLWNLYAFCLERVGERQKAIAVMEKGLKKIADERLKANLELLKAGEKMKMTAYGDMWYQFHLEKTGTLIKQQTKMVQGRRKTIMR